MAAEHPLRIAAEALCPAIRRDRADGLYIAYGALPQHAFFVQEARGGFTVLYPSTEGCQALCDFLGPREIFGFSQFAGREFARADSVLLAQGIKLMETACTGAQAMQFEKAVRQRAALLLREGNKKEGGALPLCMRIAETLQREQKGV